MTWDEFWSGEYEIPGVCAECECELAGDELIYCEECERWIFGPDIGTASLPLNATPGEPDCE